MKPSTSPYLPIRFFTICLVLVLVPLNCWWVVASTLRVGTSPTQVSLFFNAIFTIFVLLGINALSRIGKKTKTSLLNQAELLVIYTCVSVGSGLAGVVASSS